MLRIAKRLNNRYELFIKQTNVLKKIKILKFCNPSVCPNTKRQALKLFIATKLSQILNAKQ